MSAIQNNGAKEIRGASCPPLSGIVLTQGLGRPGPDHQKMLGRLIRTLEPFTAELIVVAQDPADYLYLDALLVSAGDRPLNRLAQLGAGLSHAGHSHALAVCAEQPLVRSRILEALAKRADSRWDVVAPALADEMKPFPAIYASACHARIEQMMSQGRNAFSALFKKARIKTVSEKVLRQNDPELISFLNLRQPEDEIRIRNMIDGHPL